jgi:hypothetical protein
MMMGQNAGRSVDERLVVNCPSMTMLSATNIACPRALTPYWCLWLNVLAQKGW